MILDKDNKFGIFAQIKSIRIEGTGLQVLKPATEVFFQQTKSLI